MSSGHALFDGCTWTQQMDVLGRNEPREWVVYRPWGVLVRVQGESTGAVLARLAEFRAEFDPTFPSPGRRVPVQLELEVAS